MNSFPNLKNCTVDILTIDNENVTVNETISFPDGNINKNLSQLVKEIEPQIDDKSVLFINLNLKINSQTFRQSLKGIELLIWLRLNGKNNHCVLYSFESLHAILKRDPKHIIVTSEGTTFVQLPDDFGKLKLNVLVGKKSNDNMLMSYMNTLFDYDLHRHRMVNEVGLMALIELHNKWHPAFNVDKPFISNMDELQKAIAGFLIKKSIEEFGESFDRKNLDKMITGLKSKEPKPKILHIDDQAQNGWSRLFCSMIYGSETHDNFVIVSDTKEVNGKYKTPEGIKTIIIETKCDCILLDLRLLGEEGDVKIQATSGFKLLEKVHKDFPYLPVIITTASSKAHSVKKVFEQGAEAFWSKPSIMEISNGYMLCGSYFELIKYINRSLNKYESEAEKEIVKVMYEVEKQAAAQPTANEYYKDYEFIMPDTNVFLKSSQQLHQVYRRLVGLGTEKMKVINSVYNELVVLAQTGGAPGEEDSIIILNTKVYAGYAIKFIMEKGIDQAYSDTQKVIKESTKYYVEPKKFEEKLYYVLAAQTNKRLLVSDNIYFLTNQMETRITKKPNQADDIFALLLTEYLFLKKNILFISTDHGCKENILSSIKYKFPINTIRLQTTNKWMNNNIVHITNKVGGKLTLITGQHFIDKFDSKNKIEEIEFSVN